MGKRHIRYVQRSAGFLKTGRRCRTRLRYPKGKCKRFPVRDYGPVAVFGGWCSSGNPFNTLRVWDGLKKI